MIIILVLLIAPSIVIGQAQTNTTKNKIETVTSISKIEISIKKIEPISANPKVQSNNFNHKKSNELISIKSYIRSLQLKRKETVVC
ncbi:hypothetical protein D7030_00825 [Flavobacteriaceae bacterium AU392]|nr:hypothetical protein D1817_03100 [Flavobacteriaceae bacterium]RKM86601.1 hypothetical protein D7030_00825 [Flavobacteriaceae bacterium AU392]